MPVVEFFKARCGSAQGSRSTLSWLALLLALSMPNLAFAALTVTPITWDVVGLDHNRPLTEGPNLFPVGASVCTDGTPSTDVDVELVWGDANDTYIFSRAGSFTTLNFASIPANSCVDAYYEIELLRDPASFGQSRPYQIVATDAALNTAATPDDREIFIEYLVSQNRNVTSQIRSGQLADESDWQVLGAGGGLALLVGETYFIELTTETSTGYEQVETFLTLSNTIFQVLSVETDYETLGFNAPLRVSAIDHPQLYGNACDWESDINSPNYQSCLDTGKAGGEVVITYQINIISGGGDMVDLIALIYDASGSSFHYNTDFSNSPGELTTVDPTAADISKRFLPDTISLGSVSRLLFTIDNPNPIALSGYTFTDNLPADVVVAATPNASSTCGGTWTPLAGATSVSFDIGSDVIGPNSSCSLLVDVTSALTGTYNNVSNNLFVDGVDTGNNATDTLIVNTDPPPPACVPGTEFSRWAVGDLTLPPAPAVHSSLTVADAVASFNHVGALVPPNTDEITAADGSDVVDAVNGNGSGANSWIGRGWIEATNPVTDGPAATGTSYFQFDLDTTTFATNLAEPMTLRFDFKAAANGDWAANNNLALNVHVSTNGGSSFQTLSNLTVDGVVTNQFTKGSWTRVEGTFTPAAGQTIVRVNFSGIKSGSEADAEIRLDDVVFEGCGPGAPGLLPAPPELTKNFSPDPIGVGEVSTLTFTLDNTANASVLTGVEFDDTLPGTITVASPPNASSTCGGTWTPVASDSLLQFSGGTIAASSTCTVSVDVTGSAAGTFYNISGFIYAAESGQNATSTGSASDTITVVAPPEIDKTFDPVLLLTSDTPPIAWLQFDVTNPNAGAAISGVSFSDTLPVGMLVADPSAADSGLSVSKLLSSQSADPAIAGSTLDYQITVSNNTGGAITDLVIADSLVALDQTHGADCTWPAGITGSVGDTQNVTCDITYTVSAANVTKGYAVNRATASSQLGGLLAAYGLNTPLASNNGCGAGVWSPVIGAGSVSLTGASIAAGDSCLVGAWVTAPASASSYTNISNAVTHVVSGVTLGADTATDDIFVDDPIPAIALGKQIGTTSNVNGTWQDYLAREPGDSVYYRFTIENVGETVLDNLTLNDDTLPGVDLAADCVLPSSLPVADGGDPEAHIFVCVSGPYLVANTGEVINTATATGYLSHMPPTSRQAGYSPWRD